MNEPASTDDRTSLPAIVSQYQDAHDRHDAALALSAFTDDATVIDENRGYHGLDNIRLWLDTAAREFTYTRTLLGVTRIDAETWIVTNRLEGNFPGGVADLQYRFSLRDGHIAELVIAP